MIFFTLLSYDCFSQNGTPKLKLWELNSISGGIKLRGHYRDQNEQVRNHRSEDPESNWRTREARHPKLAACRFMEKSVDVLEDQGVVRMC